MKLLGAQWMIKLQDCLKTKPEFLVNGLGLLSAFQVKCFIYRISIVITIEVIVQYNIACWTVILTVL